jgi:tetratricopeptide (TPR) repeat protein
MGIDRMSTAARIDELLSKFDENPRRYFAPLANEYRKAGELAQAIALCREHLPKQPGHMSGHIVFGQALYEYGELAEAQSVFEAALALDPENLIALRHLGDIARGRGDAASARRWYGRVLEADPRNDDIAALLASLAARATPVSSPAVSYDAPPPIEAEQTPADAFIDEPAWHTPAILGETAPVVYATSTPEVVEARVEPELLDLDSLAEPEAEVPSFFGAPTSFSAQADDAFGAEPTAELPFTERAESAEAEMAFDAMPFAADATFDATPVEMDATDTTVDASTAFDAMLEDAGLFEASSEAPRLESIVDEAAPHALLSDALGAFASHDPLDTVAELSLESALDTPAEHILEVSADAELDAPLLGDVEPEYGEGLEAIEWPDASQLAVRTPSPARSVTPVDPWMAIPVVADEVEPQPQDETVFEVESLVEAPFEAVEETTLDVESLLEAPIDAAEAEDFEVESLVEVSAEAEDFEVESLVEAPIESVGEAPVADSSLIETPFDAVQESELEPISEIDEDPPFSAAQMPWLMSTEEEREAEESDLLDSSELPESPAFVTETMAELLVAQGFVARAVGVYEELVARRPDDSALALRLAELRDTIDAEATEAVPEAEPEAMPTPIAPLAAFTPARGVTPRAVPFIAPAPRRTAREWLSLLAAMQVARRTPVAGTIAVSMPTPADGLASLFGASPLPADDVAARSLATAFGGAVPLDSTTPLFASGEFTLPPEPPRGNAELETPAESGNGPNLYSFDRFFPDPATTAGSPSASTDAAVAPSAPGARPDDPTSPGADLAQFSHWLKGLSNS